MRKIISKLFKGVARSDLKRGFGSPTENSNLATPTKKGLISNSKATFLPTSLPLSDNIVKYVRTRRLLRNRNGYPYREAEIIPIDHDMTKRWCIKYYIWDIGREKLIRRRVLRDEIEGYTNIDERLKFANECVQEINDALRTGGFQDTEERSKDDHIEVYSFRAYSLINAIDFVITRKREFDQREEGTIKEYTATKTTIIDFLKHAYLNNNFRLREVKPTFVNRYLDYLRLERNLGPKTFNCRVAMMRSSINTLMALDHSLFKRNPFIGIKRLKVTTHKHAVYNNDQLVLIRDSLLKKNEQHVLFFIQWIYFTLARPKELRHVKVGHIDMFMRRILFVGEHAKTDIEEYVPINDEFKQLIEDSGIMKYPSSYYVFSNYNKKVHTPGPTRVGVNVFYKRIVVHIKDLGLRDLNANFDLYSFKHSGAIGLYLATKDPYLVMKQCRHTTLEQTMEYLRELGMFIQNKELNKWKDPFNPKPLKQADL